MAQTFYDGTLVSNPDFLCKAGVGVSRLLHGGVPEHLRNELQLLSVLEHERGEGVSQIVEPDVRQTSFLQKRFVGAAVEVVAAHDGSDGRGEDESQVPPESPVAKPLLALPEAVGAEKRVGARKCEPDMNPRYSCSGF
jgi:hypothetical protein